MDIKDLELEIIDFTKTPTWKWIVRRVIIGLFLIVYYVYATVFVLGLAFPKSSVGIAIHAQAMVESHLAVMLTFGFLGSVFFITRIFVRTVNKKDLPICWYIIRPLKGVLMALFIYYAFRAGQLVFYSGGGKVDPNAINVYTLSLIAIVAGVFAEEAYTVLYAVAKGIFKIKQNTTET